jgi:cellulose synthase/poly-beta-1,6-N-acetylglucosamine synthase-like glycosyltransferase
LPPFVSLVVLWAVALPAAGSTFYLLVLTLLSAKSKTPPQSKRETRFDVIIPAHNEALGIEAAVRSALMMDWPSDLFRVVVVADNCTDATADIASRSGAHVLVRQNTDQRGKGYALAYAFHASRDLGWADAVVVVDADSRVSSNLLEAMACRMDLGEKAVQAYYGVSNIHASWRTRLMAIAHGAVHRLRSRARERLNLSCGVRGNGWGLTHALLREIPYASFSQVEDLEYGIELGKHRVRIAYADEAHCDGEMVSGEQAARSQRQRWEQGRMAVLRANALPLLKAAVTTRSFICLDLALDLLVLPLSYVALNALILTGIAWLLWASGSASMAWTIVGLSCCASIGLYVLRGWQLSGTGILGLKDLLRAPFFLFWKLLIVIRSRGNAEWVRTTREGGD